MRHAAKTHAWACSVLQPQVTSSAYRLAVLTLPLVHSNPFYVLFLAAAYAHLTGIAASGWWTAG